jgi:hypothetical protein
MNFPIQTANNPYSKDREEAIESVVGYLFGWRGGDDEEE